MHLEPCQPSTLDAPGLRPHTRQPWQSGHPRGTLHRRHSTEPRCVACLPAPATATPSSHGSCRARETHCSTVSTVFASSRGAFSISGPAPARWPGVWRGVSAEPMWCRSIPFPACFTAQERVHHAGFPGIGMSSARPSDYRCRRTASTSSFRAWHCPGSTLSTTPWRSACELCARAG